MAELPTLTIECASRAKATLLGLLDRGDSVEFDLSLVEAIDLSGIQVLIATVREAKSRNMELHFIGTPSEGLRRGLTQASLSATECSSCAQFEKIIMMGY